MASDIRTYSVKSVSSASCKCSKKYLTKITIIMRQAQWILLWEQNRKRRAVSAFIIFFLLFAIQYCCYTQFAIFVGSYETLGIVTMCMLRSMSHKQILKIIFLLLFNINKKTKYLPIRKMWYVVMMLSPGIRLWVLVPRRSMLHQVRSQRQRLFLHGRVYFWLKVCLRNKQRLECYVLRFIFWTFPCLL